VYSENANTTVVGDVGLFDNDSDAEEPQIIPLDELQADSESESDDEPSSENYNEGRFLSRSRQKRRYCLEGCDCERPRGRLYECEKKVMKCTLTFANATLRSAARALLRRVTKMTKTKTRMTKHWTFGLHEYLNVLFSRQTVHKDTRVFWRLVFILYCRANGAEKIRLIWDNFQKKKGGK